MYIEYDFQRVYTTTVDRAVGASTLTRVLSNTNTSEYIYLAPNGNDANDGLTPANAVQTLNAALDLLDPTHNTVHIIRNGFIGDIVINVTASKFLDDGTIIQCELGEKAYIQADSANIYNITLGYDCIINGIENISQIQNQVSDFGALIKMSGVDNFAQAPRIINCTLNRFDREFTQEGPFYIKIEYSLLYSTLPPSPSSQLRLMEVDAIQANNSIFFDYPLILNYSFASADPSTFEQCNFVNMVAVFYNVSLGSNIQATLEACNLINVDYLSYMDFASGYDFTVICDYCKLSVGVALLLPIDVNTNQVTQLTITNSIPSETPNLFVNEQDAFQNRNADSFRLQIRGKDITNTNLRYILTSQLRNAYAGNEDVTPWEETVTGPELVFRKGMPVDWPAQNLEINPLFVNAVEDYDVAGNLDNIYDKMQWDFLFNYSDTTHITNEMLFQLVNVLSDKGSKRLYLKGRFETLFTDANTGTFDNSGKAFQPVISEPMVCDHWQHFWIIFDDKHYYIESNSEDTLYLLDPMQQGFPANGYYIFSIEYLLIRTKLNTLKIIQKYFTSFREGGRWRENWQFPRQNYQYTTNVLAAISTSVLKENR